MDRAGTRLYSEGGKNLNTCYCSMYSMYSVVTPMNQSLKCFRFQFFNESIQVLATILHPIIYIISSWCTGVVMGSKKATEVILGVGI